MIIRSESIAFSGKSRFRRLRRSAYALAVILVTFAVWFYLLRRPWVRPVPGVRVGPAARPETVVGHGAKIAELRRQLVEACRLSATGERAPVTLFEGAAGKAKRRPWPNDKDFTQKRPRAKRVESGAGSLAADEDASEVFDFSKGLPPSFSPDGPWTTREMRLVNEALSGFFQRVRRVRDIMLSEDGRVVFAHLTAEELALFSHFCSFSANNVAGLYIAQHRKREAVECIDTALRFSQTILSERSTLFQRMVGYGMLSASAHGLWSAELKGALTPADRTRFMDFLERCQDARIPLVEVYRTDFAEFRDRYVCGAIARLDTFLDGTLWWLRNPLNRWSAHGVCFLEKHLTDREKLTVRDAEAATSRVVAILETGRLNDFERARKLTGDDWKTYRRPVWTWNYSGFLVLRGLKTGAEKTLKKECGLLAVLRGTRVWLALRGYEHSHGGPPEKLNALVPDPLPRIPADPFDPESRSLRYRRLPDGTWAVYSTGPNQRDDHALAECWGSALVAVPVHKRNAGVRGREEAGDVVFPGIPYKDWLARVRIEHRPR